MTSVSRAVQDPAPVDEPRRSGSRDDGGAPNPALFDD
jgi:hypothetical protein